MAHDILLYFVGIGITAYGLIFMLPRMITSLWPSTVKLEFAPDGDTRLLMALQKKHQDVVDAMNAQGFEILGVMRERTVLKLKKDWQLAMVSRKESTFANIGSWTVKQNYYFLSLFDNGAVVCTRGNPTQRNEDSDMLVESGLPDQPAHKVFRLHKVRMDRFLSRGHRPAPTASREDRLAALQAYYRNPAIAKVLRIAGMAYLANLAIILGAVGYLMFLR